MHAARRLQVLVATAVSVALMLAVGVMPALAGGRFP